MPPQTHDVIYDIYATDISAIAQITRASVLIDHRGRGPIGDAKNYLYRVRLRRPWAILRSCSTSSLQRTN